MPVKRPFTPTTAGGSRRALRALKAAGSVSRWDGGTDRPPPRRYRRLKLLAYFIISPTLSILILPVMKAASGLMRPRSMPM